VEEKRQNVKARHSDMKEKERRLKKKKIEEPKRKNKARGYRNIGEVCSFMSPIWSANLPYAVHVAQHDSS
jgi:hypothetical protein